VRLVASGDARRTSAWRVDVRHPPCVTSSAHCCSAVASDREGGREGEREGDERGTRDGACATRTRR
jgi:hypothetical protein